MKKILLIAFALITMWRPAMADEGMWLLPFMEKLNIKDMKAKGFKLSAADLYSINKNSIKDAIVIFGAGCTGEIVSSEGLLLTNHHCGYGQIQQHSTVENDYLKYGFWAMTKQQEIPSPGLTVTFIREIVDVTDQITSQLNDKMTEKERNEKVSELIEKINQENSKPAENITAVVTPMFGGNQYLMFLREKFGDVRMVGAPPSSIGKFGGETDNWMWPRHTGDFSVFRVYASPDNKSTSEYNKENKPYTPKQHLKVSLKGYNEKDFAMVMGVPGRTQRYMTTWEIDQMLEQDNPIRIYIRGERQKLMMEDMLASDAVRIKYANKYQSSSNYWKNSIGKSRGLVKLNVRGQKDQEQETFMAWVNATPERKAKYGESLALIGKSVKERAPIQKELQYIQECLFNVESLIPALRAQNVLMSRIAPDQQKAQLKAASEVFFKDYNSATDRKITPRMLQIFIEKSGSPLVDELMGMSAEQFTAEIFKNSIFVSQEKYEKFLENPTLAAIENDPILVFGRKVAQRTQVLSGELTESSENFAMGHRLYLAGLLEMNAGKKSMYPDANSTIRMTYGQVLPYWSADAVFYNYYTTLSGVIAKEDPSNPEFVVAPRLKELWQTKDFGRYAYKGDVPVAFLSNNDITGGNSGSPVLNGKGELIGLAFDGNWEAMSGDIAFEPNLQRCINVDIRYVLFIMDKFAGAKHLVDEMTIME